MSGVVAYLNQLAHLADNAAEAIEVGEPWQQGAVHAVQREADPQVVAALARIALAALDLYERVEMNESVGICLSDRVPSLRLGDALAELSRVVDQQSRT